MKLCVSLEALAGVMGWLRVHQGCGSRGFQDAYGWLKPGWVGAQRGILTRALCKSTTWVEGGERARPQFELTMQSALS